MHIDCLKHYYLSSSSEDTPCLEKELDKEAKGVVSSSDSDDSENEYFYRPSEQRVGSRAVTPRHYSPTLSLPRRSVRRRGPPKRFTPDLSPPDRFTPRPSWPINSDDVPDQEEDSEEYEEPAEEFEIFKEGGGDGNDCGETEEAVGLTSSGEAAQPGPAEDAYVPPRILTPGDPDLQVTAVETPLLWRSKRETFSGQMKLPLQEEVSSIRKIISPGRRKIPMQFVGIIFITSFTTMYGWG
ncbi:unnamed protein product [Nezara viridula]|uniref:Uncharacterized protein n=1 Tax=Nezara viridula TaxID=85310 RepID=A0A9P0EFJ6_NEZVI|nr:unnamed protein product [Nezara viridula]